MRHAKNLSNLICNSRNFSLVMTLSEWKSLLKFIGWWKTAGAGTRKEKDASSPEVEVDKLWTHYMGSALRELFDCAFISLLLLCCWVQKSTFRRWDLIRSSLNPSRQNGMASLWKGFQLPEYRGSPHCNMERTHLSSQYSAVSTSNQLNNRTSVKKIPILRISVDYSNHIIDINLLSLTSRTF